MYLFLFLLLVRLPVPTPTSPQLVFLYWNKFDTFIRLKILLSLITLYYNQLCFIKPQKENGSFTHWLPGNTCHQVISHRLRKAGKLLFLRLT